MENGGGEMSYAKRRIALLATGWVLMDPEMRLDLVLYICSYDENSVMSWEEQKEVKIKLGVNLKMEN